MQGNILIIEDDKEMSDLINNYMVKEGFEVRSVESAEDGFAMVEDWNPELIILDVNLPGMNGFEFLQKYRKFSDTPVFIVSARNSDEDQINGLGIGADEYITKPFSPNVLVARVKALFRRNKCEKNQENVFRFGPFTLYYDSCVLKKNGERIPLSIKEYGCLAYLAEHSGKPVSVKAMYSGVWGNNYGDVTAVGVYIKRLREKIEEIPSRPIIIETVYGMGYKLNVTNEYEDKGNYHY